MPETRPDGGHWDHIERERYAPKQDRRRRAGAGRPARHGSDAHYTQSVGVSPIARRPVPSLMWASPRRDLERGGQCCNCPDSTLAPPHSAVYTSPPVQRTVRGAKPGAAGATTEGESKIARTLDKGLRQLVICTSPRRAGPVRRLRKSSRQTYNNGDIECRADETHNGKTVKHSESSPPKNRRRHYVPTVAGYVDR